MKDRKKELICVILSICIATVLTGILVGRRMEQVEAKMEKTQQELAQEVFRFHVLANSDSKEDQAVKLKVRDGIIAYMKEELPDAASAKETKAWAGTHLLEMEEIAEKIIRREGYSYKAKAEVTSCYFPDKEYGDVTFPQGEYEALRICLGEAEGHNWWCVLYPSLCFTDATCAVVEEEGKKELEEALTAEEYEMITATSDFKIKWFFFGEDTDD